MEQVRIAVALVIVVLVIYLIWHMQNKSSSFTLVSENNGMTNPISSTLLDAANMAESAVSYRRHGDFANITYQNGIANPDKPKPSVIGLAASTADEQSVFEAEQQIMLQNDTHEFDVTSGTADESYGFVQSVLLAKERLGARNRPATSGASATASATA